VLPGGISEVRLPAVGASGPSFRSRPKSDNLVVRIGLGAVYRARAWPSIPEVWRKVI